MTGMKILFYLLALLPVINCRTVLTSVKTCDGIERKIIGERLIGGSIRGRIVCRYVPKDTSYTLAMRINKLSLERQGNICPTIKLIGYTSMRKMPEIDSEDRIVPGRAIYEPADPETLDTLDCNNYKSKIGTQVVGKVLGQKLQLEYDTKGSTKEREGPFDITLSSYKTGLSYRCPEKHFRCWSNKYMCIDNSLECDSENNCHDNSDEDNFKCTGRIAGLPLGMFIVVIVLVFLLVVGIIIGVVIYRRRAVNKKKARQQQLQAGMDMDPKSGHSFIGDPTLPREYSAYHPEA